MTKVIFCAYDVKNIITPAGTKRDRSNRTIYYVCIKNYLIAPLFYFIDLDWRKAPFRVKAVKKSERMLHN